ncbi:ABC transporter permease subunit [Kutzneria kofuensis]|uniref:ABC-2 type transport system permease protein n=1 Tax=Kutzneria kofuensis TaxID=103725 RepID=A0A7W9NGM7_9PSEU|nr:ABC transporter permease subunit [Kutzneria kofuensis]MBB5891699.1 ABC-2 type transport system permease protein [Kutzneria kofuensis]
MTAAVVDRPALDRPVRAPLGRLLASELRWVLRRPRTIIAIVLLSLVPVLIGVGTVIAGNAGAGPGGNGPGSLFTILIGNGFVLPVLSLTLLLAMLLPLLGAMSAADALAGESAHGTLRGLLIAPVSRARLLGVKAFGVGAVVFIAALSIALVGLVTGVVLVGTDGLITLTGNTLSFGDALARIGLAVGWVTFQVWAVAAIALAVSAFTEHPLVVMAATLAGALVFAILTVIPQLDWIQPYLLTSSWGTMTDVLRDPMPWDGLLDSTLKAACYLLIGLSVAYARLSSKDG